jgi:hypothetical protein
MVCVVLSVMRAGTLNGSLPQAMPQKLSAQQKKKRIIIDISIILKKKCSENYILLAIYPSFYGENNEKMIAIRPNIRILHILLREYHGGHTRTICGDGAEMATNAIS